MIRRIPWGIRKPPLGVQHNPSHPLSQGLVGHWLLNESGGLTAYDISGNGNHGTLTNGPVWTQGQFGPALSFDGSDDNIAIGSPGVGAGAAFTISVWFSFTSAVDGSKILYNETASGASEYVYLNLNDGAAGRLDFVVYDGVALGQVQVASGLNNGLWHNAVAVQTATNARELFVDGVSRGTNTTSVPNVTVVNSRIAAWHTGGAFYYPGKIDDVRIYNRALSADEVRYSYAYPFTDLMPRRQLLVSPAVAVAGRIFKLAGRGGGLSGPSIGLAG